MLIVDACINNPCLNGAKCRNFGTDSYICGGEDFNITQVKLEKSNSKHHGSKEHKFNHNEKKFIKNIKLRHEKSKHLRKSITKSNNHNKNSHVPSCIAKGSKNDPLNLLSLVPSGNFFKKFFFILKNTDKISRLILKNCSPKKQPSHNNVIAPEHHNKRKLKDKNTNTKSVLIKDNEGKPIAQDNKIVINNNNIHLPNQAVK